MDVQIPVDSVPPSPASLTSNSLFRASHTVDELTIALSNFSRSGSPEPHAGLTCCCNDDDCEHYKAWLDVKSKLEGRLILSAQVGQALLQKYEAYVRRHEASCQIGRVPSEAPSDILPDSAVDGKSLLSELGEPESREEELIRRNAALERRLAQALVNAEVSENSTKTLLHELQDARAAITRLSAHHARSVGWETRLKSVIQERDDMHQERDALLARERTANQRANLLNDKCAKLQKEVRKLQRDLLSQQRHRDELSEEILQDARTRLDAFASARSEHIPLPDVDDEVAKTLHSLVADNEDLKRANAEMTTMLQEAREEVHTLQEEVDELRAAASVPTPVNADRPYRHRYTNSTHSSALSDLSVTHVNIPLMSPTSVRSFDPAGHSSFRRRPGSLDPPRRVKDAISPEARSQPLSPLDVSIPQPISWTPSQSSQRPYINENEGGDGDQQREPVRLRTKKPLLLLTRSVGTQTETWPPVLLTPLSGVGVMDRFSPGERSESSSLTDASQGNALGSLIDRASALLIRMGQADALTLTNRLKRQHLTGADVVGHLSRSTIVSIVADAEKLRGPLRSVLEDDKAILLAGRRELRALLRLFKDVFTEMGKMRATLNDVILDPSVAPMVRQMALNPSPQDGQDAARGRTLGALGAASALGWMAAPITKLFGAGGSETKGPTRGSTLPPPRIVPKLQPATQASTTTVAVEFSGGGVGRAVTNTNTWKVGDKSPAQMSVNVVPPSALTPSGSLSASAAPSAVATPALSTISMAPSSVMGIFAGAPRPEADPWVMIPKSTPTRRPTGIPREMSDGAATVGRGAMRGAGSRGPSLKLPRAVDAVVDTPSPSTTRDPADIPRRDSLEVPGSARTLHRKGLSDSSMRSTFTAHARASPPESPVKTHAPAGRQAAMDRAGMLASLSKRVSNFRFAAPVGSAEIVAPRATRTRSTLSEIVTDEPSRRSHSQVRSQTPTAGVSEVANEEEAAPKRSRAASQSGGNAFISFLPTFQNIAAWTPAGVVGSPPADDSGPDDMSPFYRTSMVSPLSPERGWPRDSVRREL